uniref:Alpha-amylase n=1 Tax=Alexandrium monilatum TaxID=311494 RepID=A0A7S4RSN3_9DINO
MGSLLARSAPPAGQELLRVRLPAGLAAGGCKVVACGSAPQLGGWAPERAPQLHCQGGDQWVFVSGDLAGSPPPEALFKFVMISPAGGVQWEEGRPNRQWPQDGRVMVCNWNQSEVFEGKRAKPKRAAPRRAADCPEVVVCWGKPDTPGASVGSLAAGPSAIFHAFHWPWTEVERRAAEIAKCGFDAVQLSPAQRSKEGEQWWTRYQPLDYEEIHGLGSEAELRSACAACRSAGLRVIGDAVFNHMLVVASADEWRRAQGDPTLLEALKQRLEERVGPTFDRDDFQWPWFELQGAEWDGPMRMEGWGCGEWSELKAGSPKVVAVHQKHLELLSSAGVSGVRLDAAKHMRPAHIADYAASTRSLPPPGDVNGVFVYGEVLSFDAAMQHEYMYARSERSSAAASLEEPFPTTDFSLAAWLRWFLEVPERFLAEGLLQTEVPLIARNSVRFARNHDTVEGSDDLMGLGSWDQDVSAVATAWLLAAHDGAVLVLHKDVAACPIVGEAARHRQAVRSKLAALGLLGDPAVWTDARATLAEGGGAPLVVCVAVKSPPPESRVIAFSALNPDVSEGPPTSFQGSGCLAGAAARARFLPSSPGAAAGEVRVEPGGSLAEPLALAPGGGVFYVAEEAR